MASSPLLPPGLLAWYQERAVLHQKNTRNPATQQSFRLPLNISCILSTCVCVCESERLAGCHAVSQWNVL